MHEQLLMLLRALALMIDKQCDAINIKPSQAIHCKYVVNPHKSRMQMTVFEGKQNSFQCRQYGIDRNIT